MGWPGLEEGRTGRKEEGRPERKEEEEEEEEGPAGMKRGPLKLKPQASQN